MQRGQKVPPAIPSQCGYPTGGWNLAAVWRRGHWRSLPAWRAMLDPFGAPQM
jgi:hypothetical protein